MKFVCIMGRRNSGKSSIERVLEKIGFKRSISYSTRKPTNKNSVENDDEKEYNVVDKEAFMQLVEKGHIIEYEEYNGNLYGTPRPYGSTKFVATVCLKGFKALKEMYGKQVLGVYLKCDEGISLSRESDMSEDEFNKLNEAYKETLQQMEKEADIVINSNQNINLVIADILKVLRDLNV